MKNHVKIIFEIANGLHVTNSLNTYIELGVHKGYCFNQIAPLVKNKAYAVDIYNSLPYIQHNKNLIWYHEKTTNVLSKHDKTILFDMVFIDADHRHEASMLDFEMVLPLTKDNGIILLHDTYPPNKESITGEKKGQYCGDTYKTAMTIKQNYTTCELVTLPFYSGITIVRKNPKILAFEIND